MTKVNDLCKEKTNDSDLSKNIDNLDYRIKYKDYLDIIKKYKLIYNKNTKRFDCNNEVVCKEDLVKNGKLIIPFGVIDGGFHCFHIGLTTLENCPIKVNGNFNCSWNQLTSLEYCPKEVHGDFRCHDNQLSSLEHCPEIINGDFFFVMPIN